MCEIVNFRHYRSIDELDLAFADRLEMPELETDLSGDWQRRNSRTAAAAISLLQGIGFEIGQQHLSSGLKKVRVNTGFEGRWQVLKDKPLTICDIGHNLDGMKEVLKMIGKTPHKKLHFVLGLVADKHAGAILNILPESSIYYFCKANIPRGMDAKILQQQASEAGLSGNVFESVKDAYHKAITEAASDELVFVGGSTFVVAEII